MLVIKNLTVDIDFHSIFFPIMEVYGDYQLWCFSICFRVQQNKETRAGLEQLEGNEVFFLSLVNIVVLIHKII